jgi:hypothetical protein
MKNLLLPILLLASFCVKSQVYNAGSMLSVYHDINPDTILNYVVYPYTNETYALDLFDDPATDLEFTARGSISSGGSAAYINVSSLNPKLYIQFGRWDSVYAPGSSGWDVTKVAAPLLIGSPVNHASAIWDNTTLYLTDHSGHSGANKDVNDWIGGEKYIGLKHEDGSSVNYGWIRIKCITEDSCYVLDHSQSQTSSGLSEIKKDEAKLYPNPVQNTFYVKDINKYAFDVSSLKLADVYGSLVQFTYEIKDNTLKIDLDPNLSEGFYFLQYFSDKHVFSKKLIKLQSMAN